MLARLHRAGELTAIHVPNEVDEAIRDLTRAGPMPCLTSRAPSNGSSPSFCAEVCTIRAKPAGARNPNVICGPYSSPFPRLRSVLEEYLFAIDEIVQRLEELLAVHVPQWRMYPAVEALICLRGFRLTAAAMLIAELGDIRRFAHPRHVMAFLGLVHQQHSTGASIRLGTISKAGNPHARWIVVEVVQHACLTPKISRPLSLRQEGQPAVYRELAWKTQVRLHHRGWHLLRRGA